MKLQNLCIIFLAIALPVIIILSVYVSFQVDTVALKTRYDDYLTNASHETIMAFQLNTANNEFLTVSDAKIRDIEAALNIFSSTLATSFGTTSASRSRIMSYVPALCFTLYDGYYIYTPTKSWETSSFTHELKAYVYYSRQYTNELRNKILTINYSLDNYIAVFYYNGNSYISKAGYLEVVPSNKESFLSGLDENARKYYNDAWNFTEWFNNEILNDINTSKTNSLKVTRDNGNSALPGVSSEFNNEKYDVIKESITNNLIQAMHVYGRNSNHDFEMPKLTDEDWEVILNNVCFISFMQGLPVGTSSYNNYTIVPSTENQEAISENTIYYINVDNNKNAIGSYHRVWCPELSTKYKIEGYSKKEFKNKDNAKFKNVPACYYCVVRASSDSIDNVDKYYVENNYPLGYNVEARKKTYYSALAKEKIKLPKLSDFISGSVKLTK